MIDQTKVIQDSSGIVGVFHQEHASQSVYYALHAIQHRGQDAIGIASSDGEKVVCRKGLGLLSENATQDVLEELTGHISVGQVRMATYGDSYLENVQPSTVRAHQGSFAIVTTGMITNAISLREQMEDEGLIFQGSSDSEIIAHLIQRFKGSFEEKIQQTYQVIEGACSFMIATKDCLFVVRDRHGVHSLFMGTNDGNYIFSSETCSFGILNAKLLREVEPGEMIRLDAKGIHTKLLSKDEKAVCSMEYVYYSRVDSIINGENVHEVRKKLGVALAKKETMKADIVVSVPDSANSAATSFAQTLGIPYEVGLIKNRYIGSTFVRPTLEQRKQGMRVRLNAISSVVRGKTIFLVDDSIVVGSTAKRISQLLKEAGAKEVHMRIAAPQIKFPCFSGYERTSQEQFVAHNYTVEEMQEIFHIESLRFLDLDDFKACLPETSCLACFNGDYPTHLADYAGKVKV